MRKYALDNGRPALRSALMALTQNMAIRHKLVLVIMVTCLSALMVAGVAFIGFCYVQTRREMVKTLQTQAQMIAENLKAALTFDDAADAAEVLTAFHVEPSIVLACIHDTQGKVFATHRRKDTSLDMAQLKVKRVEGFRFAGEYLTVTKPIHDENGVTIIGTVTVWSDLEPLKTMLRRNALIITGVLLLASLVAYLISSKVQGVISTPILDLTEVTKRVSEKKEYSTRAEKHSNDEVGTLIDSFNEMLGQIQERDRALVGANELLEARVDERTAELQSANEQLTREMDYRKKVEEAQRERTERIIGHQATLLQLGRASGLDLRDSFQRITQEVAQTIEVARVGIWLFDDQHRSLVCEDMYLLDQGIHESGLELDPADYPRYFQAMEASRIVAADDAAKDVRTLEFASGHLDTFGISSLLNVPIRIRGKLVGVICHEHVGPPREWTLEEQDFAASIADMITLKLEVEGRKAAEKAIVQLNTELEANVLELKRSNTELKNFAYVTAHDLKAPLRAIGTLIDWVYSDYRDVFAEQGREQMQLVKSRVVRMNELIDSILRYSEIGRGDRNMQKINVEALVTETISKIDPPEHIDIVIKDQLPLVVSERLRLMQVFQHLIGNGVKYMDKPKGRIEVGCSDEGAYWQFYVSDNGPGIGEKYHKKIFRMFQTLTPRDELESTGIGLAVVKKIVELFGGKVWLESVEGKGTKFVFTLPKVERPSEVREHQAATA